MRYLLALLLFATAAQADEGAVTQSEPIEVTRVCVTPADASSNSRRAPGDTQTAQYQPPLCCCPAPGGGMTCSNKPVCFCF